jgi:hypothetical protein
MLIWLLVGCGDVVEKHYATKAAARSDGLFEKGWLPEFIPERSTSLQVVNNLDLNYSYGAFHFSPQDWPAFSEHLHPSTSARSPFADWEAKLADYRKRGFVVLYYEEEGFTWAFFCRSNVAECEYRMWLRRARE